ncbi:hypothetical protein M3Y97_00765100 [Aphelenchoides bicaudatus]|nr:hypothetical protein M3Y97_00765100 [Aphelenchoides bicaudatus]
MDPYLILIPIILALHAQSFNIVDGPANANEVSESQYVRPYEVQSIRDKLRRALDEMEKNEGSFYIRHPDPKDDRHSTITKNQLNRIVKAMRTRMFGSI